MFLSNREHHLIELMDLSDADPEKLRKTYQSFRVINGLLSFWKSIYTREIKPHLKKGEVNRIADVGCGDGYLLHQVGNWVKNDGFECELTGFEPDKRALASVDYPNSIHFASTFIGDAASSFDILISNHVLHHLSDKEIPVFFHDIESRCNRKAIVCDIHRSIMAFMLYPFIGLWFSRNTFALTDGLRSIRRSFTQRELSPLLPPKWKCSRPFPFRLMVTFQQT